MAKGSAALNVTNQTKFKTMIESIRTLREAANNNLKKYCDATGENYKEAQKYCVDIADEKTQFKPPVDYYIAYYNETVKLYNKVYAVNIEIVNEINE